MSNRTIVIQVPGYLFTSPMRLGIQAISLNLISKVITDISNQGLNVLVSLGFDNIQSSIQHQDIGTSRHTQDITAGLSAAINGVVLQDHLERNGVSVKLLADVGVPIVELVEVYSPDLAKSYLYQGNIVISTAAVEQSLFDDDLAAALRALEVNALAYCKLVSPETIPSFSPSSENRIELSYDEVIQGNLIVPLKSSAISLCAQYDMPVIIINIHSMPLINEVFANTLHNNVVILK